MTLRASCGVARGPTGNKEQKGQLRISALPGRSDWASHGHRVPHFRCLPHCLDICPLSSAGSPSLVTSVSDRRDSTVHALGLGNQKNTVTEGNMAFPSLALYLVSRFPYLETDWQ